LEPTPPTTNDEQPTVSAATDAAPDAQTETLPPMSSALAVGASEAPGENESLDAPDALAPDGVETPPTEDPYEGATPPGYEEWPTHGGYLGCLMGVVLALVLAPVGYIVFGLIGAALFHPLGYAGVWLAGAITVIAYLVCFVALAQLGWRLGKHFYREYPRPGEQTSPAIDAPVEGSARVRDAR